MTDMRPLSNPVDQAEARRMALEQIEAGTLLAFEVTDMAHYLLAALAQIEALTRIADRQAAQFGAVAGHRYPQLVAVGLGHLWLGPGFNDFRPQLLEGVRKHLRTHEKPCQRGHCCDYVRNRIYRADFGALELRFEEGKPTPPAGHPSQEGRAALDAVKEPQTLAEMTETERQAHRERVAALKAAMPGLTHPDPS